VRRADTVDQRFRSVTYDGVRLTRDEWSSP